MNVLVFAVLSALLSFGAVASADAGIRIDPNGSPAAAAALDQGSMIDPDGKPSR
jgi:hypothetical protein